MREGNDTRPPLERTQVVVAPIFHRSGKAWRPAKLTGLPRLTRAAAGLALQLESLLPAVDRARLAEGIRARLEEVFQEKVRFEVGDAELVTTEELARQLGNPTLLAALAPAPHLPRGLLEVELGLAHAMVDLLLGGAGETVSLRALSDIEEGVVSFVLLEALRAAAGGGPEQAPVVRLEGMLHSVDEGVALLGPGAPLVVFLVKAEVGAHHGHLRLVLPHASLAQEPRRPTPERWRAQVQAHLGRLSSVRAELRCVIGRADLTAADIRALGTGDVVLLDEATARPDLGEGGTARLEVGPGRCARLDAEVGLEQGAWKAIIRAFQPGEQGHAGGPPTEADQAAALVLAGLARRGRAGAQDESEVTHPEGGDGMDAMSGDGADLLGDVPLQLTVELARLPMTAEAVVGLRVGQVLDLERGSAEPVELSINGKVVARGELVEVEGQLGVRVQSLVG